MTQENEAYTQTFYRIAAPEFVAESKMKMRVREKSTVTTEPVVLHGENEEELVVQKVIQEETKTMIGMLESRVVSMKPLTSLRVTSPTGLPLIEAEIKE